MHLKLDTRNLPVAKAHPLTSWHGGHIIPGKGTRDLRIGQSMTDVELILGNPNEKRSLVDHFFYVYKSPGIDVDFGCSQWVKRLFFYDVNVEGHTKRAPVALDGIGFRTPKTKVINVLGKPQCEGGPVRVANRKKTWIYYDSGLQFDFDSRDRVIIISVCDPKLNRPAEEC
ncbi:MAG: hypothetical protein ABSD63_00295 [Candidatus Korobacteraceae bacterium]|jgi:hypothetical protein